MRRRFLKTPLTVWRISVHVHVCVLVTDSSQYKMLPHTFHKCVGDLGYVSKLARFCSLAHMFPSCESTLSNKLLSIWRVECINFPNAWPNKNHKGFFSSVPAITGNTNIIKALENKPYILRKLLCLLLYFPCVFFVSKQEPHTPSIKHEKDVLQLEGVLLE